MAFRTGTIRAALSLGLTVSIVATTYPASAQTMNRARYDVPSDSMRPGSTVVDAHEAADAEKSARGRLVSEPTATQSIGVLAAREAARIQQPPPKPHDLIPSLPRRGRCSMAKGAAIGAGIGGGAGFVAGAVSGSSSDIGGHLYPALVFGAFGAGIGAAIGLLHCR